MDEYTIHTAINAAPATEDQIRFATNLLGFLKHPLPPNLKFGEAERLLDEVAPHVNERILMDEGWSEGDVLVWRDAYLLIEAIHTNKTFTLARVELRRQDPDRPIEVVRTLEPKKVRHPFTLYGEATKVNPETHQP